MSRSSHVPPSAQIDVPNKQIRAHRPTPDTIVIFKAFSEEIANAALAEGRLNASSEFKMGRMTYMKPSFYWCMYRSGWSYKDPNRSRILAITMTLTGYLTLLRNAVPNSGSDISGNRAIRFQWDPERNVKLAKLPYRSLQLGISEDWVERWIDEWIVGIQDITEDVRRWKAYIDADQKTGSRRVRREVAARWTEEVVEVDEEIEERLGMRDTTA